MNEIKTKSNHGWAIKWRLLSKLLMERCVHLLPIFFFYFSWAKGYYQPLWHPALCNMMRKWANPWVYYSTIQCFCGGHKRIYTNCKYLYQLTAVTKTNIKLTFTSPWTTIQFPMILHLLMLILATCKFQYTATTLYFKGCRVRMRLESPWKSLNFKIKNQGLESPWKLRSVLESAWNLLPMLSNEASQVSETKINALSTLSIWCDIFLAWFHPSGVLEKWKNVSLKGLEKSLNFWSKKVYEPWGCLLNCMIRCSL